ncbi:MAG: hypothetical protein HDR05_12560 [Lachnospiraceae bacterium]|nr:hypothetical protein [Lachnospiraceae bacterium]
MKRKHVICFLIISTVLYGCCNSNNDNASGVYSNQNIEVYANSKNKIDSELISGKWYLFQLTSKNDREIYEIIYNSLVNKMDSIEIKAADTEQVDYLFKCVIYDNPDIFFVSNYEYIQHSNNTMTLFPVYNMDLEEIEEAQRRIEEYVDNVLEHIRPEMCNYEKELVIYDYIARNTEYNIESEYNQNLYSVTLGRSVCMGYTKMFKYLCQQVGIPCTVVIGQDKSGVKHAWNVVFIDDNWYMVDCTQSKGLLGESKGQINYYYFNITKEQIDRSYSIDNFGKIPDCNSIEAEYFNKEGLYFDKVDIERYRNLIESAKRNMQDNLVIRCADINIYNEMITRLINEKEILNMFETSTSINKTIDPDLLIIKIEW